MKRSILLSVLAGLFASCPVTQSADYAAQVQALIPRLADADVPARYAAQMELQDLASDSSKPGNDDARLALGKVLADFATDAAVAQPARVWMVRQLEYMGDEEAVPSLTTLLADADGELRECARRALEKNPSQAATESLRAALKKSGDLRWHIGLMNSVAERRDAAAVPLIRGALKEPETADAAAYALGRIASREAVEALLAVMNDSPAASLALVEAGNRSPSSIARLAFRAVYERSTFAPARAAALGGLVRFNPNQASELIASALDGTDPKLRQAALNAAEGLGTAYMPVLAAMLPNLSPAAAVQVIGRLNQSVEPAIIKAAGDPDDGVRTMAIKRLGQVGSAASVSVLLEAAAENQRAGAGEARTALVTMRGRDAVDALQAVAGNASAGLLVRVAAIDALVAREATDALPALMRCALEQGRVGVAAITGVGRLGGADALVPVARIALDRQSDEAFDALEQIAGRVEDGAGGSRALIALAGGNERTLLPLLDTLGTLGGPEALEVVSGFLKGSQADAAIRALAKWPDLTAAGPLLKVASDAQTAAPRHALALTSVLDLLRENEATPANERADLVLAAWKATRDIGGRKRVLAAMGTIPDPRLVGTITPLFGNDELKAEAVLAATSLAEGLARNDKAAAAELAKAIQATEPGDAVARRLRSLLRR